MRIKSSVSFSTADSGDCITIEYEPVQNGLHGSKRDVKVLIEDFNGEKADALMSIEELCTLRDICQQMLDFINAK